MKIIALKSFTVQATRANGIKRLLVFVINGRRCGKKAGVFVFRIFQAGYYLKVS